MRNSRTNIDWTYIRSFLAVAETGSLTAAAHKLNQSQPTLGRHIKAAEQMLGTTLFIRTAKGLELTDAGRSLIEPARDMALASAKLETLAAGQDLTLGGTVRITASVVVSHYILPAIVADLRVAEPEIEIEIAPSDSSENLIFREADIAIRMYRPTQLDVIARKIGEHEMVMYAAKKLIAAMGQPEKLEDLMRYPFVGFDRSEMIIRYMRELGFDIDAHFFGVRCDDQALFWRLVCSGCGIGAMQAAIGEKEPLVQRVECQPQLPSLPIWLAAHQDMYQNARVKRVWDYLATALNKINRIQK